MGNWPSPIKKISLQSDEFESLLIRLLTKINTAADGEIIFWDPASFNLKYNNITQMNLSEVPSDAPALVRKNRSKLKLLMTAFQNWMQWPTEYSTD